MNSEHAPLCEILMVSTDLDGSLLDHHSYSWQEAVPAIERLKSKNIPIIFNTSKTFDEVELLRQKMHIDDPFVVENGSALFLPKYLFELGDNSYLDAGAYWKIELGISRLFILDALQSLRNKFSWKFEGISDWTLDQIVDNTGLSESDAKLVCQRYYSEPIIWQDNQENFQAFRHALAIHGLKTLKGGRFIHIQGNTDKGKPLQWFTQYYSDIKKISIKWIVLGDGQNDIDMLSLADFPVAIKSPSHDYPQFTGLGETLFTREFGPEGWNQAIFTLLKE